MNRLMNEITGNMASSSEGLSQSIKECETPSKEPKRRTSSNTW